MVHDKKSEQLFFCYEGDQWVRQKIQGVTVCYSLQLHLCFAFTCREWSRLVGAPLIWFI